MNLIVRLVPHAIIVGLLVGCASLSPQPPLAGAAAHGERIVADRCAACHGVGRAARSPHPDAIPFSQLSRRYPPASLGEAFAEGVVAGHPDMPGFEFQPDEIDALIAYLEAIQERPPAQP
jgi:cytochrome c